MDGSLINRALSHFSTGLPLLAEALLILWVARWVFLRTMPFDAQRELVERPNRAYAVVFAAYLLGAALALAGAFFGIGPDPLGWAAGKLLVDGALVVALLRISIWVNDQFILTRFAIDREIGRDQNLGVAFCVAGTCVASGLTLNGAMSGFSASFSLGLRDTVLFWLLGQAVLVLVGYAYRQTMRYDVHRLIEYDDNAAVGVAFGAMLTGVGVIVRSAQVGSGHASLTGELAATALIALSGSALLLLIHSLTLRLISPPASYAEEVEMKGNVALSAVASGITLAAALCLGAVIQR